VALSEPLSPEMELALRLQPINEKLRTGNLGSADVIVINRDGAGFADLVVLLRSQWRVLLVQCKQYPKAVLESSDVRGQLESMGLPAKTNLTQEERVARLMHPPLVSHLKALVANCDNAHRHEFGSIDVRVTRVIMGHGVPPKPLEGLDVWRNEDAAFFVYAPDVDKEKVAQRSHQAREARWSAGSEQLRPVEELSALLDAFRDTAECCAPLYPVYVPTVEDDETAAQVFCPL
jgi:hypothetical protein